MTKLTLEQQKKLLAKSRATYKKLFPNGIMSSEYGDGSDEHFTVDGKDTKASKEKTCKE